MNYRADANNEPAKEVRSWNGIPLNITTKTGEPRFSFAPPMSCDYGCIRGSWGAGLDGKALDVYVVSDAPTVFKVVQITPTGAIDEYKYVLGARSFDEAVETFLKHVPRQLFGAASQYSIAQLQDDIGLNSKVKTDADDVAAFVEQLEELIEDDDAYDSNIYVLSFEVADNGDISGKFKDAWNGRIFTYSVQKTRIGYKPALTLDRADSSVAKLFDVFSSGYTSLGIRQDAIKNGKKPRCTAVSYSCGKICLSLQNTCWINSAGQKVKKAGGAVASISQSRIDKLRTLARYLAANGNNKWSKYGRAETLAAKANNLEAKRVNLFTKNTKEQSSDKLLITQLTNKHTEPIEPPPNASDKEWKNFETAHKLWLENGDDSPYNKIQSNGKSIEQQKKEKIVEEKKHQLEAIKILPVSVKRHIERTAYDEIAKSKGSPVYSGYANEQDEKDATLGRNFLKSKLSLKQKEAVQVYTKVARLKAYQEYESIYANSTKNELGYNFPPYDPKTRRLPTEYKQIGDGISAEVYLDRREPQKPKALKYAQSTDEPLAIEVAKAMGDLGIAPKIYGSIFEKGKVNAIAMEYLDGYRTLGGGDEMYYEQKEEKGETDWAEREKNSDIITKNILVIGKIAHDNGFAPSDLHEENLMYNPKTLKVKFIDIDDSARATYKDIATQLLSHQEAFRPMLAQNASWYASKNIPKKDYKEFQKLQKAVRNSLDNQGSRENPAASPDKASKDNFSEDQYKEIVEKAYKLLGLN